jgi:hypothetical protein
LPTHAGGLSLQQSSPISLGIGHIDVKSCRAPKQAERPNVRNTSRNQFDIRILDLEHGIEKDISFAVGESDADKIDPGRQLRPSSRFEVLGVRWRRNTHEPDENQPCQSWKTHQRKILISLFVRIFFGVAPAILLRLPGYRT